MSVKLWTTDINWIELWTTDINLMYLWDTVIHWIAPVVPSNWLLDWLVSYYKADDNWTFPDVYWSNDWTISWATYTASWKINWGYSYDWTNDYVNIANQISVSSAFSISSWIKFDSLTPWATWILTKRNWSTINDWVVATGASNNLTMIIWHSWWTYVHESYAQSNFDTSSWWHITFTFLAWWFVKLYVNWTKVWTDIASANNANNDNVPARFGHNFFTWYFWWDIDETWIWSKELTEDKITALYNAWRALSYDDFTTVVPPLVENLISSNWTWTIDTLYIHEWITSTVTSTFSTPWWSPNDIAIDTSWNLVSTDWTTDKFYVHSWVTDTITTSFSTPAVASVWITIDSLDNLISVDYTARTIYIHTWITSTITSTFVSSTTTPQWMGIDNQDNLISASATDWIYVHSWITSTITTSFDSPYITLTWLTVDWDQNLISSDWSSDKVYVYSWITSTVTTSFNAPELWYIYWIAVQNLPS